MSATPPGPKEASAAFRLPEQTGKAIFLIVAAGCLLILSAPVALLAGLVVAQVVGNPFAKSFKDYKITGRLLQYSVVGLGFGMSIGSAVAAGRQGVLFTMVTIAGTLLLGTLLGILMKVDRKTTHLISSGTAICGGSAIAAVAPVIRADEKQISVALGIVFILNSIALFVFPPLGRHFDMSDAQFGLWAAIAIHDTSSVVGAAKQFSTEALGIATVVKLARALWIIPLALVTALFYKGSSKVKIPWFIGFFILAMLINTYVPFMPAISPTLVAIAKAGLVLTLYFIGTSLSLKIIRSVGALPLVLGIVLWLVIAGGSLAFILHHVP